MATDPVSEVAVKHEISYGNCRITLWIQMERCILVCLCLKDDPVDTAVDVNDRDHEVVPQTIAVSLYVAGSDDGSSGGLSCLRPPPQRCPGPELMASMKASYDDGVDMHQDGHGRGQEREPRV